MNETNKLTIGMATYDDYDGVYFTIKSIQLYHSEVLDDIEFLILDNNPDGPHGAAILNFLQREVKHKWRYMPIRDNASSFTKYRVFEFALTPYTLCMDSHVLLERGCLEKLLTYYKKHPNTKNLLQGPLILGNEILTHWDNKWWKGQKGYMVTDKRGINPKGAPFEIQTQGMALFSAKTDSFPQLNPLFSGFGGEEGYIQEKFRKQGGKALCLPFLRWHHRFDENKPQKITYPRSMHDRVRNNLIAHIELDLDVLPLFRHFADEFEMQNIDKLYENVVSDLQEEGYKVRVNKRKLAYMQKFSRDSKINDNNKEKVHA